MNLLMSVSLIVFLLIWVGMVCLDVIWNASSSDLFGICHVIMVILRKRTKVLARLPSSIRVSVAAALAVEVDLRVCMYVKDF